MSSISFVLSSFSLSGYARLFCQASCLSLMSFLLNPFFLSSDLIKELLLFFSFRSDLIKELLLFFSFLSLLIKSLSLSKGSHGLLYRSLEGLLIKDDLLS